MSRWQQMMLTVLCMLFLWGCSQTPHEDAIKAQTERACVKQCDIKKAACLRQCRYSCRNCDKAEHAKMVARYKTYVHEQNVQGERVALQLQSFKDPLQCRKTSCDCYADHRICTSACKGKIQKRLLVAPYCC